MDQERKEIFIEIYIPIIILGGTFRVGSEIWLCLVESNTLSIYGSPFDFGISDMFSNRV
jgi:hypothetical protein